MNTQKSNFWIIVGLVVVAVAGAFFLGRSSGQKAALTYDGAVTAGAIGTKTVESYIPVIKYNEGYYSALPIQTTSTLNVTGASTLGAINSSGAVALTSTFQVGTNGSAFAEIKGALCNITGTTDTAQTASTTDYYYCSVTGVASGDVVFAQLSTTTSNALFGGWWITSAKASSTAGFIDLLIYNGTGADRVPSAAVGGIASSTNVVYFDI